MATTRGCRLGRHAVHSRDCGARVAAENDLAEVRCVGLVVEHHHELIVVLALAAVLLGVVLVAAWNQSSWQTLMWSIPPRYHRHCARGGSLLTTAPMLATSRGGSTR